MRGEILRLLLQLRATSRISILIVTHDLGLAWTIADRVAVMYLGRIVEVGPTREVLTEPAHPYTRALLDVVPDAERPDAQRTAPARGRAARPDAHPRRLPVPSALSCAGGWRGGPPASTVVPDVDPALMPIGDAHSTLARRGARIAALAAVPPSSCRSRGRRVG